jgi:TPP-dependent indolepyruvate ferredoxin oxidoreductase alpha subunit
MTDGTARSHIYLEIDESTCRVCDDCSARHTCRGSAIRVIDRGEAPFLDMSRCWGCLVCVQACPFGAVVRREVDHAR